MLTPWADTLDRAQPLPEYPRPQMVRDSYLNLNGPWSYAITTSAQKPAQADGTILVPFSPESELSGVGRVLQPDSSLSGEKGTRIVPSACAGFCALVVIA